MNLVCKYCNNSFVRSRFGIFCSNLCSNRFNKNRRTNVILPRYYTSELAEMVGILLGDGNISKYQLKVTLNCIKDIDYVFYVINLITNLFQGVKVRTNFRNNQNCVDVVVNSVDVVKFFVQMGIKSGKPVVPSWIYEDKYFVIACIRGLVDTEGSISFKKYLSKKGLHLYPQLAFTSKNSVLLKFVEKGLTAIGLKCSKMYVKNIYLSTRMEITRYNTIVGFGNSKLASIVKGF